MSENQTRSPVALRRDDKLSTSEALLLVMSLLTLAGVLGFILLV